MIVLLHNIRSMHNVGSIFRTADAAGVKKIYLCGITSAPIDKYARPRAEISKTALGAENYVPWESVKSTTHLIDKLKKDGYTILAVEQSKNSIPYYEFKSKGIKTIPHPIPSTYSSHPRDSKNMRRDSEKNNKFVTILGNEINGLSPAILKRADKILEIPMRGKKESLNVAVAFGIIVFYLKLAQ